MSCLILSNLHHSTLAAYAVTNGIHRPARYRDESDEERRMCDTEIVARHMHRVNVEAYRKRYENSPIPLAAADRAVFTFAPHGQINARNLPPIAIIKAARCFAHQACDAPLWDGNVLCRVIEALIGHAIGRIQGYEAADWAIV